MKREMIMLAIALAYSSSVCFADSSLTATGGCQRITEGKDYSLTLKNERLAAVVEIRESPFSFQKEPGHTAIWGLPKLTNLSGKPYSVTVSAAFFDQSGELIIALSQEWHKLEPNQKDFQLASCIQRLPEVDFKRIHSCTVSMLTGTPRKPSFGLDEDAEEEWEEE